MKTVSDQAIILSAMDYREADRIVTLFCRDLGKISALARGARRSRKRFGGALELFARLNVTLALKDNLSALGDCDIVTVHPRIRADFTAIAHASYACELAAALIPEHLPNQRLFRLLSAYLEHLDSGTAKPADRHFFEMNLLNILGYRPPLESCSGCGANLVDTGCLWNVDRCLCRDCAKGLPGERLGPAAVALLLTSLQTGRFGAASFSDVAGSEAGQFLDRFIGDLLPKPLKSLHFLRLSP
ncbi:MAG: DNA repair protein RecO [Geobacter sp.]|nr:DNA repair protein RecO [Geobacter sp.]